MRLRVWGRERGLDGRTVLDVDGCFNATSSDEPDEMKKLCARLSETSRIQDGFGVCVSL